MREKKTAREGLNFRRRQKMNVTRRGNNGRKFLSESCSQRVLVEPEGYVGAPYHEKITENNANDTENQTDSLLERILHRGNLIKAYKQVKSNNGAGGIDRMQVADLLPYLEQHGDEIIQRLREGKYKPNPVRRVEIPKEEQGKVRKLGIPTVVDRFIQQAISQELSSIFEAQFHESSYGFRPNRSAHDALKQCQQNIDDGYVYVVDMDLEKFFDTVCQSKLIQVLSETIKDGRVISLIHKYLNAGIIENEMLEKSDVGVPQGGPLSPLLSNIMLNELDWELHLRGHRFVRYADDCMIFCKSKRSAERTLKNILPFIERKLFLKVNKEKTEVAHISKVTFLGYAFYRPKGKCRFRVHPKSIAKMRDKLRTLTSRSNGWSNDFRAMKITQFIRGWVNYFKLADMKTLLMKTDEWLRRRIRAIYWTQWKKVKTRYKMLKQLNVPEQDIHKMANSRKGTWRSALMLNYALTTKQLAIRGFTFMAEYFSTFFSSQQKLCVN
jgi:group II intron reverse transcriptase/maturase